jgi:hypothetical protein
MACLTKNDIIANGGQVYENPNGTVSVFLSNGNANGILTPEPITLECCTTLGYTFDEITQKCKWNGSAKSGCDYTSPFNLVLNPNGNDGAIFSKEIDETCTLSIDFDYLFKFDCDTLGKFLNGNSNSTCKNLTDIFEQLGASAVIDIIETVSGNTVSKSVYEETFFPQIGTGNLYAYLSGKSSDTGFYVCGNLINDTTDTNCYPLNLYNLSVDNDTLNCVTFVNQIISNLLTESGVSGQQLKTNVGEGAFSSNWLNFNTEITDPNIISQIENKKIKLTIKLSGSCIDSCVLLDNIKMDKKCTRVSRKDIFVKNNPSFELDKIIDNKKSWIANTERTHRTFNIAKYDGSQSIRYTDYYLEDARQVINTKEIDLDIDIAAAVETDVWSYVLDNPCLLTGVTIGTTFCTKNVGIYQPPTPVSALCPSYIFEFSGNRIGGDSSFTFTEFGATGTTTIIISDSIVDYCVDIAYPVVKNYGPGAFSNTGNCCPPLPVTTCLPKVYCCSDYCGDANININGLMSEKLSGVTVLEDFQYLITSELIDVKDRKTLSSYPTLRLLYERYMNSQAFCNTTSSKFDYYKMDKFASLIGSYWVDLIEQTIPATTIWRSTKIYTNTIFDNQKFKYRGYSTFFGFNDKKSLKPLSPVTGDSCNASCETVFIEGAASATTLFNNIGDTHEYDNLYALQMNSGSEFISMVKIIGPKAPSDTIGVINECLLAASITNNLNKSATIRANAVGAIGNVTYSWTPTNETTQTIGNLSAGTKYTVLIKDKDCKASASITIPCSLSVTATSTPAYSGANGTVTASVTGQVGNVAYLWTSGSTTIGTTSFVGGLTGGTYNVMVTQSGLLNCSASTSTVVIDNN